MTELTFAELRQKRRERVTADMNRDVWYGVIGRRIGTGGQIEIYVPDEDGMVYVRCYTPGSDEPNFITMAVANNVMPLPDVPVRMKRVNGVLVIEGTDPVLQRELLGSDAPAANVGKHTHTRASGNAWPIEPETIETGMALAVDDTTLNVYVMPGFYRSSGSDFLTFFPGGTVDLTGDVPASDEHCWVLLYVDHADNLLKALAGTPKPRTLPLSGEDIQEFDVADRSPLSAVRLQGSQTAFTEFTDFLAVDARMFRSILGAGGGGGMTSFTLAADTGTPETIGNSNTLTVAGGADIDTSVAPTDTVTVAASPRLSAAASLFLYDTYFNFS